MKHKYPPNKSWFACNVQDIGGYIRSMVRQVAPEVLTAERLKRAIDEDSSGEITLEECQDLVREYPGGY